jgi:hypothetical protein
MTAIAIGSLWLYRTSLVPLPEAVSVAVPIEEAEDETQPAGGPSTLVIAVGGPSGPQVCAMAVPLARAQASIVHVLHVVERDVVAGEDAIDLESETAANDLLGACVTELSTAGVPVVGELLHSVGTHADVAARILNRAAELSAGTIVLGPETHRRPRAAQVAAMIAATANSHVIVLHPDAGPLVLPEVDSDASHAEPWHVRSLT